MAMPEASIGPADGGEKHFSGPVAVGFYASAYDSEVTVFQALRLSTGTFCHRAGQGIDGGKLCTKRFPSR
jgi:hypothetical protein